MDAAGERSARQRLNPAIRGMRHAACFVTLATRQNRSPNRPHCDNDADTDSGQDHPPATDRTLSARAVLGAGLLLGTLFFAVSLTRLGEGVVPRHPRPLARTAPGSPAPAIPPWVESRRAQFGAFGGPVGHRRRPLPWRTLKWPAIPQPHMAMGHHQSQSGLAGMAASISRWRRDPFHQPEQSVARFQPGNLS